MGVQKLLKCLARNPKYECMSIIIYSGKFCWSNKCCSENMEVYVTFVKMADKFLGFIYFRHNVIFSFVEIGLGNIILKLTPSPLSGGIFDYVSMVIHNFVIIHLK